MIPTLALNVDRHLLSAALPLLRDGAVGGVEWSFDAVYALPELPPWFAELLTAYAGAGRLVGHGIFFSVCAGEWRPQQQEYLDRLRQLASAYPFDHVTEHFGFMTGRDFHRGAPLAPPLNAASLRVGRDRLARLHDAAACRVGLENLALAYSAEDVYRQADFLDRLLGPTDGLLILDLHNLYCQAHNFGLELTRLVDAYPLHRVREIHLSGGSWEVQHNAPGGRVRRDTHDDRVPDAVYALLAYAIPRCPRLKYVVLEQLSPALRTEEAIMGYREDFKRLSTMLPFLPEGADQDTTSIPYASSSTQLGLPHIESELAAQQEELSCILEDSESLSQVTESLANSRLAASAWQIETWSPHMLETAWKIARKWK